MLLPCIFAAAVRSANTLEAASFGPASHLTVSGSTIRQDLMGEYTLIDTPFDGKPAYKSKTSSYLYWLEGSTKQQWNSAQQMDSLSQW